MLYNTSKRLSRFHLDRNMDHPWAALLGGPFILLAGVLALATPRLREDSLLVGRRFSAMLLLRTCLASGR